MNTEVYNKYAKKLMETAFASFKRFMFRQKIKNIKRKKWQNFLRYNLMKKYLDHMKVGTRELAKENRDERLLNNKAD